MKKSEGSNRKWEFLVLARAPPLCESAKSKCQRKGEHLSHTHSVGSEVKEH